VAIWPAIIAYVLGACFSLDLKLIVEMLPLLLSSIAYGAVIVLSAGLFMLGLSSLSRNSRYVAGFWVGVWFITSAVSGVVGGIRYDLERQERWAQAGRARNQQFWMEEQKQAAEFFQNDWSPMISYTANLQRIGRVIMNTDAAWDKWFALIPSRNSDMIKAQMMGPLYPWYWSALILAALAGISLWILTSRVKSLDRLR
jgi:hypothetical protein